MTRPRWNDVRTQWEPDGGLRDIYIHGTSEPDWQAVIDAVRSQNWPSSYSEDGEQRPTPDSIREILSRSSQAAVLWSIAPTTEIRINCHFFTPDEIDFDLAPNEIADQTKLDVVDFVRLIGRASGRFTSVCYENAPEDAIMRYDPRTDLVTV